jgi:LuxR family maltose regulon positive regulatory protein
MTQRRCREAIALAEQHGWGAEPVISPALVNLARFADTFGDLADPDVMSRAWQ